MRRKRENPQIRKKKFIVRHCVSQKVSTKLHRGTVEQFKQQVTTTVKAINTHWVETQGIKSREGRHLSVCACVLVKNADRLWRKTTLVIWKIVVFFFVFFNLKGNVCIQRRHAKSTRFNSFSSLYILVDEKAVLFIPNRFWSFGSLAKSKIKD